MDSPSLHKAPSAVPLATHLTPAGYRRLCARIEELRGRYLEVCKASEAAQDVETSVWHDNFDYEEIQRQMHQLSRRVRDQELARAAARVMPLRSPEVVMAQVRLGCVVTLIGESDYQATWLLAGFDDGDVERGRLSYNSPLGGSLLGRQAGDIVTFMVGGAPVEAEIVSIRPCTSTEDEEGLR